MKNNLTIYEKIKEIENLQNKIKKLEKEINKELKAEFKSILNSNTKILFKKERKLNIFMIINRHKLHTTIHRNVKIKNNLLFQVRYNDIILKRNNLNLQDLIDELMIFFYKKCN